MALLLDDLNIIIEQFESLSDILSAFFSDVPALWTILQSTACEDAFPNTRDIGARLETLSVVNHQVRTKDVRDQLRSAFAKLNQTVLLWR